MIITDAQSRAARGLLGWTQADLAASTGLSRETIQKFERGGDMRLSNVHVLRSAFEKAGVQFIARNGGGIGVRFCQRAD